MYINQWFASDLPGSNLLISKCYLSVSKPQFQISMRGKINKLIENRQIKSSHETVSITKKSVLSVTESLTVCLSTESFLEGLTGVLQVTAPACTGDFFSMVLVWNAPVQLCYTLVVAGLQPAGLCLWSMLGNTFSHFHILNSQRILIPCLTFYLLILWNEVLELIRKCDEFSAFCHWGVASSVKECINLYYHAQMGLWSYWDAP